MSKIDSMTMWLKDVTLVYNDTDISSDYWHGYGATLRYAIEDLIVSGGDEIHCAMGNNPLQGSEDYVAQERRVHFIAKRAGYIVQGRCEKRVRGDGKEWDDRWFVLLRDKNQEVNHGNKDN